MSEPPQTWPNALSCPAFGGKFSRLEWPLRRTACLNGGGGHTRRMRNVAKNELRNELG